MAEHIAHLPLILDSVRSGAANNVFVFRDTKLLAAFDAGKLETSYPGFTCLVPVRSSVRFSLEGRGTWARLTAECEQPECTTFPDVVSSEEAVVVVREAVEFSCPSCPTSAEDEFGQFVQTRENAQVWRKFEYCRDSGRTNVEIAVRAAPGVRLSDARFYESLPKECISDLRRVLAAALVGNVSIKYDPLIVWNFEGTFEEQRMSYALDAALSDECRETIAGFVVAGTIENGRVVPATPMPLPAATRVDALPAGPAVPSPANSVATHSPSLVEPAPSECAPECSLGSTRCQGARSVQRCTSSGGCLIWTDDAPCSGGTVCRFGSCEQQDEPAEDADGGIGPE